MQVNSIIAIATLLVFTYGCRKNDTGTIITQEVPMQSKQGIDYIPDISSCYAGVTMKDGQLRFETRADFLATLNCLESKSNEMDSMFLNDWGFLSDSLLNAKEEEINYSEELVYKEFEDFFGLNSLRKEMNRLDEIWLNTVPFDTSASAIPNHILMETCIQSVFSYIGTVNVDDTLSYIEPNGNQYYVTNGNQTILDSIVDGIWSGINSNVMIINDGVARSTCKATKSGSWKWRYNGKYAARGKAGFYNIYWRRRRWYATTHSFKKSPNNKWKYFRTQIESSWDSEILQVNQYGDCTFPFQTDNGKKKRKKKWTFSEPYGQKFKVYSGGHETLHWTQKVPSYWHTVVW